MVAGWLLSCLLTITCSVTSIMLALSVYITLAIANISAFGTQLI